jgi:hypothetical protein
VSATGRGRQADAGPCFLSNPTTLRISARLWALFACFDLHLPYIHIADGSTSPCPLLDAGYASEGASRCAPGFFALRGSRKPCERCSACRTTLDNPAAQSLVTNCFVSPGCGVVTASAANGTDTFSPNTTGLSPTQLAQLPAAECPVGWFGPGNTTAAMCQRCPVGSSTQGPGSFAASQCNVCIPGFGLPSATATSCQLCPFATFQPDYQWTECQACPNATFYAPVDGDGQTWTSPSTTLFTGKFGVRVGLVLRLWVLATLQDAAMNRTPVLSLLVGSPTQVRPYAVHPLSFTHTTCLHLACCCDLQVHRTSQHASQSRVSCRQRQAKHSSNQAQQLSLCSAPPQLHLWAPAWLPAVPTSAAWHSGMPRRSPARQHAWQRARQTLQPACSCTTSSRQAPWLRHRAQQQTSPLMRDRQQQRRWHQGSMRSALFHKLLLLPGSLWAPI